MHHAHITTAANTIIKIERGEHGVSAKLQQSDLPEPFLAMVMEHLSQGIDITDIGYQEGIYRALSYDHSNEAAVGDSESLSPKGEALATIWLD